MRTSPSSQDSQMSGLTARPDASGGRDTRPAARVRKIVWAAQAAALRNGLAAVVAHQIECSVAAELDAMEMPEVFFTSLEVAGRVVTCDLDSGGTASIFGLIDPGEYDELLEEAGDDALLGVDCDGVYVTPARTRH